MCKMTYTGYVITFLIEVSTVSKLKDFQKVKEGNVCSDHVCGFLQYDMHT